MHFINFTTIDDDATWYCVQICADDDEFGDPSIEWQNKCDRVIRDALKLFKAGYMGQQLFFKSAEDRDYFKTWAALKWA
jgi:hypothetical protein